MTSHGFSFLKRGRRGIVLAFAVLGPGWQGEGRTRSGRGGTAGTALSPYPNVLPGHEGLPVCLQGLGAVSVMFLRRSVRF
jgi:hypothetical protein